MTEIEANRVKLNVAIDGPEGAPVVMLSNSLGTDLRMWEGQIAAFSSRFRVVRYDNRGHGKSSSPSGEYTMEQLARDAIAIMDAFKVERVHWCGLSLGGMVGQWLAANAPERIESLVLANTGPHFSDGSFWANRIKAVTKKGIAPLVEGTLERWFSATFRARASEAIAHARAMLLATSPMGYAGCCAAIRDIDLRGSNRRIYRPALVLAGRHDLATPVAMAESIHKGIAGSCLSILDAGHLSNIEQQNAFNEAVLKHLQAVDPGDRRCASMSGTDRTAE